VGSPVAVVWDFFQDVPAVAACMPGVELGEPGEDGAYRGTMKTKLGPISAAFQGTASIAAADVAARTGRISAQGVDKRQASRVRATVDYALAPDGPGTAVEVTADIALQGTMAQFGRTAILQEVSSQMTREFARCVEARLSPAGAAAAPAPAPRELDGLRLMRAAFAAWWRRVFRRRPEGGRA
jgi:uncharacterized protein